MEPSGHAEGVTRGLHPGYRCFHPAHSRDPLARNDGSSFRDAPLGAGPESIATNVDVARSWGRCAVDNRHRWLWIPGSRSARPGMTRVICPTGKSAKPCPAQVAKIFRFTSHPNQFYRSAVSRSHRGAYHDRHERWRGMRWTRQYRRRTIPTRTAKPCGPGAPTLASSLRGNLQATVATKPGHRGERGISRKPLRRESRNVAVNLW